MYLERSSGFIVSLPPADPVADKLGLDGVVVRAGVAGGRKWTFSNWGGGTRKF